MHIYVLASMLRSRAIPLGRRPRNTVLTMLINGNHDVYIGRVISRGMRLSFRDMREITTKYHVTADRCIQNILGQHVSSRPPFLASIAWFPDYFFRSSGCSGMILPHRSPQIFSKQSFARWRGSINISHGPFHCSCRRLLACFLLLQETWAASPSKPGGAANPSRGTTSARRGWALRRPS